MKHHPFTEIWPLMRGEDFAKFKADIAANGLRLPILTYDGQLLDGRNRERACEETGVPARYEDSGATSDEAALDLVVSLNEQRRHLSLEERAFAAARLANIKNGGDRKSISFAHAKLINSQTATMRTAAARMNVSYGSAARAKAVLIHGDENDENDVVNGNVTLTQKAEDLIANRRLRKAPKPDPSPEKAISIHVLIEELHPLFKEVQAQSQCHQARVSQTVLAITAGKGLKLLEMWASDDPTVRRMRGHVVPFKQPAMRKKG